MLRGFWSLRPVALTGKRRHRTNRQGELVLQLQEKCERVHMSGNANGLVLRWRDATIEDISEGTDG